MEQKWDNFTESAHPTFFVCDICDYTTEYRKDYNRHLLSKKHKQKDAEQTSDIYKCEYCVFQTKYKYNYTMHMSSQKHINNKKSADTGISHPYQCEFCNKMYSSSSNLMRHKKSCKTDSDADTVCQPCSDNDATDTPCSDDSEVKLPAQNAANAVVITPDLFMQIYKQNSEFQALMLEQQKYMIDKIGNTTNNSINTSNSHNKNFNIQIFLNEHCKNAIDINDFVKSLNYSTTNLEENMKLGYVGGISKMMTDKIRLTPVERRPMHCCDEKREKLYIKNNGEWVTGNDSNIILQSIIADIANNNYRTFQQWALENPSCMILDTPAYKKYMIIFQGVIGSRSDDEEIKHVKKILSNILDDIVIEKDKYLV